MIKTMKVLSKDPLLQELCRALTKDSVSMRKMVSFDGTKHGIVVYLD